ncbi:MAG: hypothetical protein Q9193_000036 [Seirophora villosa]
MLENLIQSLATDADRLGGILYRPSYRLVFPLYHLAAFKTPQKRRKGVKMKGFHLLAFAGLLVAPKAALELVDRGAAPPVVALPIQKRHTREHGMYYFANVSLGTPAQTLRLQIDTESSDMRVHSASIPECQGPGSINCSCSGTFDINAFSTYTYLNSDFKIWYQDSHNSHGDYALETVSIGGQQLNDVQFGIGYNTVSRLGIRRILGIGHRSDEAIPDNRMF